MTASRKSLKKLLTSSSLIAALTASASPSFAGAQDSLSAPTGNPNSFNNTNDWRVGGFQNVATPNNNPLSMVFFGQAQNMNLDNVIGNIGTLNLYGFDGQTFNITAPNSIEGIISDVGVAMAGRVAVANGGALAEGGAGAGAKVNLNVNIVNDTLELVTNQLGALGNTTLVSANTTLKLSGDNSVIDGTIDGGSPGNGRISVNANNVTFNGVIGGTLKINSLRAEDNKSATLNADSSYLGGGLIIGDTAVLTLTAGKTVDASGASINFTQANSTLTVAGDADTTIIGPFNANVVSGGIIKANGLTAGKTLTLQGSIGSSNNPLALIEVTGGGTLKLRGPQGETHDITTVDISGANRTLILNGGGNSFNLIHDNNEGIIVISDEGVAPNDAATVGINRAISSKANPLERIKFIDTGGGALVNVLLFGAPTDIYAAAIETDTAQKGVLIFTQGTNIIDSPIGAKALPLTAISVNDNTTVELRQDVFLNQNLINLPYEIGLAPGSLVKIKGNLTGDIIGVDAILTPTPTPTINGTVEFINPAPITVDGILSYVNTVNITDSDVSIKGDFTAQTTNFNVDSKLIFPGNQDRKMTTNIVASNIGSIIANDITAGKTLTLAANIGDLNNPLKLIEATGGGTVKLTNGQGNIANIDIRGADGAVELQSYNTIFNLQHDNNLGNLIITDIGVNGGFVALGDGTTLSTAGNPLNTIKFHDTGTKAPVNVLGFLNTTSIDIYAGSIETDLAGKGIMVYGNKTANIIDAKIGTAISPLGSIAVGNTGTSLEIRQSAYITGFAVYDDATLKIGADITTPNLGGGTLGGIYGLTPFVQPNPTQTITGTVSFINAAPVTITGDVVSIKVVEMTDKNVTITSNLDTQTLNFNNAGQAATLQVNGNLTLGTGGATTAGDLTHTIKVGGDFSSLGKVGAEDHRFKEMNFSGNATFNNPVYADSIKVADTKTVTFKGQSDSIAVKQITLNGNSTIDIAGAVFYPQGVEIINGPGQGTILVSDYNGNVNGSPLSGFGDGSIIGTQASPLNKIMFHNTVSSLNVLAMQGKVDIYANSIETDTASKGIILFFDGTTVINAPIGKQGAGLAGIALQNPGSKLTLKKEAFFSGGLPGGVALFGDVTLQLEDNFTGRVSGAANNMQPPPLVDERHGTLEFINISSKTFTGDATFLDAINLSGNDQTITGKIDTTILNFTNANLSSTLTVTGSTTLGSGGAVTAGDLTHSLVFKGGFTPGAGPIGTPTHRFKSLSFDDNPAVILPPAIYAGTISANNSTLIANTNSNIQSNLTGNNVTFNLGSNVVTYKGEGKFGGNLAFNTTYNGNDVGRIVVDGNTSEFDFSLASNTTVILNATTPTMPVGAVKSYLLFDTINNGFVADNNNIQFVSNETNQFVTWYYDATTHTLSAVSNLSKIVDDVKNSGGNSQNVKIISILATANSGAALEVVQNFADMTPTERAEAIARLAPAESNVEAEAANVQNVETEINSRITNTTLLVEPFTTTESQGVAAGDGEEEIFRHGFWASSFYSKAQQKKYSINPGYKTSSGGATLGYDTMVNDDLMLGAAFSVVASEIKAQDQKAGDSAKVDTMMFSLYGLQEFRDDWFVQGIASFGSSQVRNHEQRNITGTLSLQADSKYNSMTYNMQAIAGHYYHLTPAITVTPMAGMRYERFNSTSYQETGAGIQNLWIKRKASDMIEAIVGARVTMETEVNQVKIIPYLHAFGNFDLKGKPTSTEIRVDGLTSPLPDKAQRPTRRWYNLGAGLAIKYGRMEYGAIYEAQLDKKYIAHQGILKVRINF